MPTDSATALAGPEFLRGLPEIELHCHLEGSVPAATTDHPDLPYREMFAGITDGLEAAERDLG
jgi:adenosine deaminase